MNFRDLLNFGQIAISSFLSFICGKTALENGRGEGDDAEHSADTSGNLETAFTSAQKNVWLLSPCSERYTFIYATAVPGQFIMG